MRKFSIKNEREALFHEIRKDIFTLKKILKDEIRIKVSIPLFYRNALNYQIYQTSNINPFFMQIPNYNNIFGIEIVNGYNNQICVFDEYAQPGDEFLEPILITL